MKALMEALMEALMKALMKALMEALMRGGLEHVCTILIFIIITFIKPNNAVFCYLFTVCLLKELHIGIIIIFIIRCMYATHTFYA